MLECGNKRTRRDKPQFCGIYNRNSTHILLKPSYLTDFTAVTMLNGQGPVNVLLPHRMLCLSFQCSYSLISQLLLDLQRKSTKKHEFM